MFTPSLTVLSGLARGEEVLVIPTPPVQLDVGDGIHHRDDVLPVLDCLWDNPVHQDRPPLLLEVFQAGVIEHLDAHLLPDTPPAPPDRLQPHRVGHVCHQRELVDTAPRSGYNVVSRQSWCKDQLT